MGEGLVAAEVAVESQMRLDGAWLPVHSQGQGPQKSQMISSCEPYEVSLPHVELLCPPYRLDEAEYGSARLAVGVCDGQGSKEKETHLVH